MARPVPKNYESKYAEFIRLCAQSKQNGVDHVIIPQPWVLGDTYEEIIESLSRLSESGLALHISRP